MVRGGAVGDEAEVKGVSLYNKVYIHTTQHMANSQLQGNNAVIRIINE